jgi:hypothetical protein
LAMLEISYNRGMKSRALRRGRMRRCVICMVSCEIRNRLCHRAFWGRAFHWGALYRIFVRRPCPTTNDISHTTNRCSEPSIEPTQSSL